MKRILSLVLAFVFVFTLAGVASADFSLSGQFIAKYHTTEGDNVTPPATPAITNDWIFETVDDTRIEILLKGSYGNVTGDLKYRLKLKNDASIPLEGRTANLFYKFSDAFSLGLTWDKSGDPEVYQSPILPDLEWEYIDFYGNGKDVLLVAKVNLGDLAATILSDLYEDEVLKLMSGFTYNLDPIFIAGGVFYNDGDFVLQPSVMYALSDEIRVGGEVYYNSDSGAAVKTAVGVGGLYKTDVLMVNGGVYYDLDSSNIGAYGLEAEYTGVPNFKFYTYYYHNEIDGYLAAVGADEASFPTNKISGSDVVVDDDSIEAGATYYLDPKKMSWVDFAYNWTKDKCWYEFEFGVKF